MCDYNPEDVVIRILKRLPVKSLVRFRSICKSWNSEICDPCFISTHLQASLSNNTPFLLLRYENYYLHYDNDVFDKFKQLQFPPFGHLLYYPVVGSCNGLICVRLYPFDNFNFFLWNPSIQKYISLPQVTISKVVYLNVEIVFDLRTNDYKLLIVAVCKIGGRIEPYLFSLNGNCWKRVTTNPPNYAFDSKDMNFVNGAVHWLGRHAWIPRVLRFRKYGEVLFKWSFMELKLGRFRVCQKLCREPSVARQSG
ncbi:hypothetical protein V6N11_019363 [Hibiscus sabdariffa]|uniref:Uncharacterized protein n=2 Tax=Hibiscus sabdariffa TaxID=183260 RepID=A0ABR1ZTP5_9ROSI